MNYGGMLVAMVLLAAADVGTVNGDVIITIDGDEINGRVTGITDGVVRYIPEQSSSTMPGEIDQEAVFMVKYDDGRKEVFARRMRNRRKKPDDTGPAFSAAVFMETGLFGLVNINEDYFDPDVFTMGVTPSIDRRLNRYLSIGCEYMILWAKAPEAPESRFIMNGNGVVRLSFPVNRKWVFLTQLNAGVSIWPGAKSVHPVDSTFFNDRIGWDFHGGIGLEYRLFKNSSLVLFTSYNANSTTLHDIPVTIDMLLISIGPRIRF